MIILRERPSAATLFGGFIVVVGLLIAQSSRSVDANIARSYQPGQQYESAQDGLVGDPGFDGGGEPARTPALVHSTVEPTRDS